MKSYALEWIFASKITFSISCTKYCMLILSTIRYELSWTLWEVLCQILRILLIICQQNVMIYTCFNDTDQSFLTNNLHNYTSLKFKRRIDGCIKYLQCADKIFVDIRNIVTDIFYYLWRKRFCSSWQILYTRILQYWQIWIIVC